MFFAQGNEFYNLNAFTKITIIDGDEKQGTLTQVLAELPSGDVMTFEDGPETRDATSLAIMIRTHTKVEREAMFAANRQINAAKEQSQNQGNSRGGNSYQQPRGNGGGQRQQNYSGNRGNTRQSNFGGEPWN